MERICKYCGLLKPAGDFVFPGGHQCKDCQAECNRLRRQRNSARIKESKRLYYKKHKKQLAIQGKVWRQENRDYSSRYYKNNRDALIRLKKQWYLKNREKIMEGTKRRREANLEYNRGMERVRAARRRGRKQRAGGRFTDKDIIEIKESQRGRCFYCGAKLREDYHIDHFMPLSKGGTNHSSNLRLACPKCNFSKGARIPHEFIQTEFGRLF